MSGIIGQMCNYWISIIMYKQKLYDLLLTFRSYISFTLFVRNKKFTVSPNATKHNVALCNTQIITLSVCRKTFCNFYCNKINLPQGYHY